MSLLPRDIVVGRLRDMLLLLVASALPFINLRVRDKNVYLLSSNILLS